MKASLQVSVNNEHVGTISRESGEYIFSYASDASQNNFVSLTMPVRSKDYVLFRLHPIFEMHLPEGYLLSIIKKQFAKLVDTDDFGILALLAPSVRGRVTYSEGFENSNKKDSPVQLDNLLHNTNNNLFDELVNRFALRSALSGVQPKVLARINNKATLQLDDYIVKAWGPDFPELALNEYCCMLAFRYAGIEVPEFYLSDDHSLFIMKRFDLLDNGQAIGFEDMSVLQAKHQDDKYTGSYEGLSKTIKIFASARHKRSSLEQFYKMIVLNNILQNGDAHLKNFGMVYSSTDDIRLAPAYDIVCTTAYIKQDISALTLMGSKKWWGREYIERFGMQACDLKQSNALSLYEECLDALKELLTHIESQRNNGLNEAQQSLLNHLSLLIKRNIL